MALTLTNLLDHLWKGIGATNEPREERMSRVEINKYLATRSDLLPYCNNCEKKIDMMEFITSNLLRFKCHSAIVDEHVSNAIVRSQDKMCDYLAALPEKKVFKLTIERAVQLWNIENHAHWRPHCRRCNKRIDGAFMHADGRITFRCHDESMTSNVPSGALESRNKFMDYAMSLADIRLFSAQVSAYAQQQNFLNVVDSASFVGFLDAPLVSCGQIVMVSNNAQYQPSYHPPAQPKPKQPKLAPLLLTDHVPRAITFDD